MFAPPIPGVNGNEIIYQSSTQLAKKQKFLFKEKDPSRDYSNHSSAHLVSSYEILAEIYSVEGDEIGLREFLHELKDGKMCTYIMDIYASHKTPGSRMPISFSNIYPKSPPVSTPNLADVSRHRHPRIRPSEKAAAMITASVPELNSVDPPSVAPAGKKPPLNPLSTSLKWSSSKRKFDVFTSGTDMPCSQPSRKQQASVDHDMDSLSDDSASSFDDHQADIKRSKSYAYPLFGRPHLDGRARASQQEEEDLAGESLDSLDEDEVSPNEPLSDDDNDADDEDDEVDIEDNE